MDRKRKQNLPELSPGELLVWISTLRGLLVFASVVLILVGGIAMAGALEEIRHRQDAGNPEQLEQQLEIQQEPDTLSNYQALVMAIAFTESRFNPDAVGKAHDSGVLQLTPIYVKEVNRIAGTDYQLEDAFDIDKAIEIFDAMQAHYNPDQDIELAIRLHNKSPYYRREVLKNLEFIKQMESFRKSLKK